MKYAKQDRTLTIEEYIEQKQIQWFRDMIHFYDKQDAVKDTEEENGSEELHPSSYNVEEMDEYDTLTRCFEVKEITSWLNKSVLCYHFLPPATQSPIFRVEGQVIV